MARLAGGADISAPSQGKQVTVTTETVTTPIPAGQPPKRQRAPKGSKPSLNEWFTTIRPDERPLYSWSIYRDDNRVMIIDENLDDRASGGMLDKFTDDQIKHWPEGPFLQELTKWTQDKYGGGDYHIMVQRRKDSHLEYNKHYSVVGDPIPSAREDWKPGHQPYGSDSGSSFMPALLRITDDLKKKIEEVAAGRASAPNAVADVAKTIMESNSHAFKWVMDNMPKTAGPEAQLQMMQLFFNIAKEMYAHKEPGTPVDPMASLKQSLELLKAVRDLDPKPATPNLGVLSGIPEGKTLAEVIKDGVKEVVTPMIQNVGRKGGGTDWAPFLMSIAQSPAVGSVLIPAVGSFFSAGAAWLKSKANGQPSTAQPVNVQQTTIQQRGRRPGQPFTRQPAPGASKPAVGPQSDYAAAYAAAAVAPQPEAIETQPTVSQPEPAAVATAQTGQPAQQLEVTPQIAHAVLFEYACQQLVQLFADGESGETVAGALDRMFPALAEKLKDSNELQLRIFIATTPTLSPMKDHERLPQFLKEFLGYFKQPQTA